VPLEAIRLVIKKDRLKWFKWRYWT